MDLDAPLHDAVDARADDRPDDRVLVAIRAGGGLERWTVGELADASRRMAGHLAGALDVGRRDRVGLVLPQRPAALVLHVACSRLGAIAAPVSPRFGSDGLAERLADAAPAVVVTSRVDRPLVEDVIDAPVRSLDDPAFDGAWRAADPLQDDADVGGDDPMWLVSTSGTTRAPRGVLLPHRVLPGRMEPFREVHPGFGPGSRFYTPADWSWIGGLHDAALAPVVAGGTVVAHERFESFDAAGAVELMVEHGVTHAFLGPSAIKALAREGGSPRLDLDAIHSAGAPLAAAVETWAEEHLADHVGNVYGLTEAAFLVGTRPGDDVPPGATGRPLPGQNVDLDDGEIVVGTGTPTLMLGYWRGPDEEPKLPLDDAGRFRTGDLADRDEDGVYRVRGRKDEVIVTSGHRVSPAEVEAHLRDHEAVSGSAVVGVPDDLRGERIVAFVVTEPTADASAALETELTQHVKKHLAAHAYPQEIIFVERLPRTPTGKVQRDELRRRAGG